MRWAVLATLVVLVVVGCVPLILEERHEFVVEVAGEKYLDEVMKWYHPSYSDYILQKPVIVLYYGNDNGSFVAAAGEKFSSSDLKVFLEEKWKSYNPRWDVDVFVTDNKYYAKISLRKAEPITVTLVEFEKKTHSSSKNYYEVQKVTLLEEKKDDQYELGDPSQLRTSTKGFAVLVRSVVRTIGQEPTITEILGAEVVWPVSQ